MSTTNTTMLQVTDENFDAEIVQAQGMTVAKFSAEWCAPCHVLTPIFDAVAATKADRARFVGVDADASPQASVAFGVRGLPTILFLRNGKEAGRIVGAVPRQRIEAELERVLSATG